MANKTENRTINMYVNGKQVGNDINAIRNAYRNVAREVNKLDRNSDEYRKGVKKLRTLKGELSRHQRDIKGVESRWSKLKGMASAFGPAVIAAMAGRAVVRALRESIDLFRQQEKAVAKVEQALRSTGNAAGRTLTQLKKDAAALQETTLFGDEDIMNNVTAQLLTFTNIANEEFDRTQAVALDLATVLDGDLKSASIQLGKALNDPVANLSALSRSGIQFSEDQKKVIKELANTNRLAEAQQVILSELERQYGGQAAAAAKVDGGLTQLSNRFGDLLENVGKFILKGLQPFIKGADTLLDILQPLVTTYDDGSKALERHRVSLNALVSEVTASNTSQEKRVQLIEQLKREYPEFTKRIDVDKASNQQLLEVLKGINKEYINSIILQRKQEEIKQKADKVADLEGKRQDKIAKGLKMAAELEQEYGFELDRTKGTIEQIGQAYAKMNDIAAGSFSFGASAATEDLRILLGAIRGYEGARKEAQTIVDDLEADKLAMAERLGINVLPEAVVDQVTVGGTGNEDPEVTQETNRSAAIKASRLELKDELLQIDQEIADAELAIRQGTLVDMNELDRKALDERLRNKEQELQAVGAYANTSFGIMRNLGQMAGESAAYQQELALFQNAVNGGLAITQAASSVKAADPFTYLALLGTVIGVISSTIGQAKQMSQGASVPSPPAFATGTDNFQGGGLAMVGERGAEMVNLPAGSQVIPAGPSRNLLYGDNPQPDFSSVPDLSGRSGGSSASSIENKLETYMAKMDNWAKTLRVEQVQTGTESLEEFNDRYLSNLKRVKSSQT